MRSPIKTSRLRRRKETRHECGVLRDSRRQAAKRPKLACQAESRGPFGRQCRIRRLSPRGGLALLNAARAFALLDGQDFVLPEHVQAILPSVVNHRLPVQLDSDARQLSSAAEHIIESVSIS